MAGVNAAAGGSAFSPGAAITAADVVNTPAGTIAATTVQAALNELDTEKVPATRQVATAGSLTGGGTLAADRTLQLVSDSATPGNLKLYGTDGTGAKGWFAQPVAGAAVQDEGSGLGTATTLNFAGAGVVASFATGTATITIPGGTGLAVQDEASALGTATTLNFAGAGVTATFASGTATITIPGSTGAVSSVFTRTGAVAAASGDYAVAQVTGAAPLASPTFTGTPAAPTAAAATNTTQIATTAFATAAVAAEATARSSADAALQPLSAKTTARAALTWAADTLDYFTGTATAATTALTAYGRLVVGQALTPAADQVAYWSSSTVQAMTGLTALARTVLALSTATLWRAAINKGTVALTDAATIATDCSLGNFFTVTLGGNRTLGGPTNIAAGASYVWAVTQDGTGTRTLAYNAAFDWGAAGAPTLTTTASKTDYISAYSPDGTKLHAAVSKGFS